MTNGTQAAYELPHDNAARIVIYDALVAARDEGSLALTSDDLMARVISRLTLLAPREIHITGERVYVEDKVSACVEAGVLELVGDERELIRLGERRPQIAYPDGSVRDYEAGLEAAKERIQADDEKLRRYGFDACQLIHSVAEDPNSEHFAQLVNSMQERGFLEQSPILESASGKVIDGRARVAAAAVVGLTVPRTGIPARQTLRCIAPSSFLTPTARGYPRRIAKPSFKQLGV